MPKANGKDMRAATESKSCRRIGITSTCRSTRRAIRPSVLE
jgi:hypothetical protein